MKRIILFIKGRARRFILYPVEPTDIEVGFAASYLKKDINKRQCIICEDEFWTVGKSQVCRKSSCYKIDRRD